MEDPPRVPPSDMHILLTHLSDLEVYGQLMREGVLVQSHLSHWWEDGITHVLYCGARGEILIYRGARGEILIYYPCFYAPLSLIYIRLLTLCSQKKRK